MAKTKRQKHEKALCPICGMEGIKYTRTDGYIYFIHYDSKIHKPYFHYVGPQGTYKYVEKMQPLNLRNVLDIDYLEIAENSLRNFEKILNNSKLMEIKKMDFKLAAKRLEIISQKIEEIKKLLNQDKRN